MEPRLEHRFYEIMRSPEFGLDPSESAEERLRILLQKIPDDRAMVLLSDFEKNMRGNRDKIRNPTAYLMGMANRVISALDIPDSRRVQHELDRLYHSGKIRPDDLDERCRDSLKSLPESNAMDVLRELDSTDISAIMNVSAFFMGLMKKYDGSTHSIGGNSSLGGNSRSNFDASPRRDNRDERGIYGGRDDDRGYPPTHFPSPRGLPGEGGGFHGGPAPRAPSSMPWDLMYGFGDREYRPEMPRILEGSMLPISVQDQLEILMKRGILQPNDIDHRVVNELKSMPEEFAVTVAKEFSSLDKSTVRNVPNYLLGIARRVAHNLELKITGTGGPVGGNKRPLDHGGPPPSHFSPRGGPGSFDRDHSAGGGGPGKRFRGEQDGPPSHYAPPPMAMGGMGGEVPPFGDDGSRRAVDMEIDNRVRSGLIRHEDIDDRVRDYLAAQSPRIASQAIADFCAKDMMRIKNKSNFLKGIVRKLVEKEADIGGGAPGGGDSYPSRGGGYPPGGGSAYQPSGGYNQGGGYPPSGGGSMYQPSGGSSGGYNQGGGGGGGYPPSGGFQPRGGGYQQQDRGDYRGGGGGGRGYQQQRPGRGGGGMY